MVNLESLAYGLFLLIIGILFLAPPIRMWSIKIGNVIRGSKTEIKKETITAYKFFGVILIISGLLLVYFSIINPLIK